MIIKEAPVPLTTSRPNTATSMVSSCPSIVRSVRSDLSRGSGGQAYQTKGDTGRIIPFRSALVSGPSTASVSRPSTASVSRPSTTSVSRPSTTSVSRPSTASTLKSTASKRVDVIRNTSPPSQRPDVTRPLRPVSGGVSRKKSPSFSRPKTATTYTSRSRTVRTGSAKTQNESNKNGEFSPQNTVPNRTCTSNDILVHLFNMWQPQLCSSYRVGVKYIPTNPKQMKAYVDAMLMDRKRSHYLNKFRAIGRVAETVARFSQRTHLNDSDDSESHRSLKQPNDNQNTRYMSRGEPDQVTSLLYGHQDSASFRHSISSDPTGHNSSRDSHQMGHDMTSNSSYRMGQHSGSLGHISLGQLQGRHQHQLLQKSLSHGHFRLKESL